MTKGYIPEFNIDYIQTTLLIIVFRKNHMKYIDITIDYCLYLPTFFVANSAVIKKSEVLRVVPIRYKPIEDGINY